MTEFLLGLALGTSAGITPGPLLAHVIRVTLRSGGAAGRRAALAPLVTDVPVALMSLTVLHFLPTLALYGIGALGGAYLLSIAVAALRRDVPDPVTDAEEAPDHAGVLGRAALVNLLSPHPWLFWATVLGPLLVSSWRHSPAAGIGLLVGFYAGLLGSKVVLATVVARASGRLSPTGYRRAVRAADLLLLVLGALLVAEFVRAAVGS